MPDSERLADESAYDLRPASRRMVQHVYIIAAMNNAQFAKIAGWLTQAGLAGEPETAILTGFCERCVAAGMPLARALVLIDTLHPVYEGRLVRWGHFAGEAPLLD
jgi:hypothetical protein